MTAQTLNVKRLPWAENMVEIDEGATVQQLLQAARLDWEVEFSPLYRMVDTITVEHENPQTHEIIPIYNVPSDPRFEVAADLRDVRIKETHQVLGQVRNDYKITQNEEAFTFADNLVDSGGRWIAAGSQYDNKVVFGIMQLAGSGITVGGEDPIDLYLMIRTSHNGGTGIQVIATPVRARCENMLTVATRAARFRWSIRHVSTLEGKLAEARETLQLATGYMDALQTELEQLIDLEISMDKAVWTLERVIPTSRSKRSTVIEGILAAYQDEDLNGYTGTGYGLLNGLTDFYDHNITRRSAGSRLQEQVDGEGAKMRNKLVEVLLTA